MDIADGAVGVGRIVGAHQQPLSRFQDGQIQHALRIGMILHRGVFIGVRVRQRRMGQRRVGSVMMMVVMLVRRGGFGGKIDHCDAHLVIRQRLAVRQQRDLQRIAGFQRGGIHLRHKLQTRAGGLRQGAVFARRAAGIGSPCGKLSP